MTNRYHVPCWLIGCWVGGRVRGGRLGWLASPGLFFFFAGLTGEGSGGGERGCPVCLFVVVVVFIFAELMGEGV